MCSNVLKMTFDYRFITYSFTADSALGEFLPLDAILAWYMLWPSLCVSVCLTQVGILSKSLPCPCSPMVKPLGAMYSRA